MVLEAALSAHECEFKIFAHIWFYLWLCLYSLALIYYVQGLARFVWFLMFSEQEMELLHLPAQFNATITPLVFHPLIIWIFCINPDLLAKVFNEMYDQDSSDDGSKVRRKHAQLSVQEQIISGNGFLSCAGVILYGLSAFILNDMPDLLINIEQLQFLKSSKIAVLLTNLLEMWFWVRNYDDSWAFKIANVSRFSIKSSREPLKTLLAPHQPFLV